ncbi:MAG: NRDE family protein, partial [Deltaproteobacteria bacterium]|nr:NRDE family protein [Deltaproteobacteria bacterium]
MCLILFSYQLHSEYPLILASNRDEFYDRPTAPAAFWEDAPEILAGRDLKECGTWLGITKSGRIATLTNYRDPFSIKDDAPSRGELVSNFHLSHEGPTEYVQRLQQRADEYNGFNLIFGYVSDLYYFSNRGGMAQQLVPGLYGLSNHLLDTPWTKVEWGKKRLADLVSENKSFSPGDIFHILADRSRPEDILLPDTGVG